MKITKIVVAFLIIASAIFIFSINYFSINLPFLKNAKTVLPGKASEIGAYPVNTINAELPPELTARAATVIDNTTGITLYEKNPGLKHLPASTTKLMTALVTLEGCWSGQIIKVGFVQKDGSLMGLSEGDSVTVENLLYGLLVPSGNDAAYTLAYSCADSYQDFISQMNKKAKSLGMTNTHFVNPAGYDDDLQYSTAADLTKLSRAAVANPLIAKIVKTKSIVVNDKTGIKTYFLENVNKLLGVVPGVEGVKTGRTEGSLENLVTKTTRNGHSVITIVLGSQDRFGESTSLIEWAFKNHNWINPN